MTGADAESVAAKLAAYMRAQAAWRRALALREARRAAAHRRSADAIEAWAQYVEALPIDDPNLAAIAAGQAMIGSPPEFRPRGDGGAMIRGHGYPNTAEWDEATGEVDLSLRLKTPEPAPHDILMNELASLEGPARSVDEVAHTT